jgi:mannose-6-phosphate isomerase-like protein (cupin superfamily)
VSSEGAVIVVPPGEGVVVPRRYGEHTVIKAGEAETRGAYAIRENRVPASSGGVPMHIHHQAEEAFFVLEGELTLFTEGRALVAPAGSFALIPRGTVHSIANRGTVGVRWLTMISPAWVSGWIEEEGRLLESSSSEQPRPVQQQATYASYGLEIVGPPPI